MKRLAGPVCSCVSLLVALLPASGPLNGAAPERNPGPRIGIEAKDGGRWSLHLPEGNLLGPGPLFQVVAGGVSADRWQDPSVEHTAGGSAWRMSGPVAGIAGLEATVEIVSPAGTDCWEYRLSLKNSGTVPLTISRADAFVGRLEGRWRGLAFTSKWGEEWEPAPFVVGDRREIEVRTGRSALGQNPWVGLEREAGGALVIAPVWSGNWHVGLAPAGPDGASVAAGISPWKFSHILAAGGIFEAPPVLVATGSSLNEASVALGRAVAATLPRSAASEAIPVEWNSWWPYEDKDINEAVFLSNVEVGTRLGIEVSTLDAGWFGESGQDTAWWDYRGDFADENRVRFPHGIAWLAEETRRRGQKFGIWMELEAVGLKTKLRREHPELLARRDDDPPEEPLDPAEPGFLGYVCLGSPAGRAHAREQLESLAAKTHCEWIKVDFNLDPKAGCSRTDHGHGRGDGLYAHYRGLYAVLDEFRQAHPEIILEACASGGLRLDAGLLRHVHCAFLSDPDWTRHHLQVVHGTSRLLPPAAMLHWPMSEFRWKHPQQTLDLRAPSVTEASFDALVRAAFLHRFGISWRLPDLPERWRERFRRHANLYKDVVRPFVRNGDLRRLTETPRRGKGGEPQPAFQLSLADRHLLLGFMLEATGDGMVIRPAGLKSGMRYRLRNLDFTSTQAAETRTGEAWMKEGLPSTGESSFIGLLEPVP